MRTATSTLHGVRIALGSMLVVAVAACSSLTPPNGSDVLVPASPRASGRPISPSGTAVGPLPPGFTETTVFSGLVHPTAAGFARDGRVFVAEKSGRILVFDGLGDPTPTVFADLESEVYDFYELGMLGLELSPDFPQTPYVYVLYTYDAAIGGTAPRWNDVCPGGPGPKSPGCLVSGRLSRLEAAGDTMVGREQVLINDWCVQFESHTIGTVKFGPDGALYASGGEGSSPHVPDYGQLGNPPNACGDPVANGQPPDAQGGALRSQDLLTREDPTGLSGTVIRIDPLTGKGLPDNPLAKDEDPNARRIVAYGFRNPFRFTFEPGTGRLWVGDVGWANWDEIDRFKPPQSPIPDFGWPCYEGGGGVISSANYEDLLRGFAPADSWPLDDASGRTIHNAVEGGADGTFGPTTQLGRGGLLADSPASIHFDGQASSEAQLPAFPMDSTRFAMALWIAPEDWHNGARVIGNAGWELGFDDHLFFRLEVDGKDHFASAPKVPALDRPHLIVASYDGSRQQLFVDGQVVGDNLIGGELTASKDAVEIGHRFTGSMDDAAYFDAALSPSQITALWDAGTQATAAPGRQPRYAPLDLSLCDKLYEHAGSVTESFYAYEIGGSVAGGDDCPTGANAISGLAFYESDGYPQRYRGGLFFSDFTRGCIWFLPRQPSGEVVPQPELFMRGAAGPVQLDIGTSGDLYYVDLAGGTVRRISYG